MRTALTWIAALIVGLLCVAGGVLWLAPPAELRVATNYAAKIVCTNVFWADRDAQDVLEVDVQAPGHPLLRFVSASVDPERGQVQTRIFGLFAPATAQMRPGLGCANVQGEPPATAAGISTEIALPPAEALWPDGQAVTPLRNAALDAVLNDPALLGPGYRGVVIVKDGRILAERYGAGFDEATPLLGWSMTKTVTAALIGTLVQSDKLALEAPLTGSFPAWAADGRAEITLSDMLSMTSGLAWNEGYGSVSDVTRMLYLEGDMAGFAASLPLEAAPGASFAYSSGTSTMLARVWQDAVGESSLSYPQRALFEPLGMASAVMEADANDTFVGSSYMYATARDWARFGMMLARGGQWDGEQIVPEAFVARMAAPVGPSDGRYTQGQMWREAGRDQAPIEDGVWMRGHDGQFVGVFPDRDLVIVRLGLTPTAHGYTPAPLARAVIAALDG
ncbi:MAG: serine hydrolase [Pseudomonadota bacterium]